MAGCRGWGAYSDAGWNKGTRWGESKACYGRFNLESELLKPNEARRALPAETGLPNLNTSRVNFPSIGALLACYQGLVAAGKEAFTVLLIHFTLQEQTGG